MNRRSLLAGVLAVLPAAALLSQASMAAEDDCGCGPKSNPKNRADHFYKLALAAEDPVRRRQLAELALSIWPEHEGAAALLVELSE